LVGYWSFDGQVTTTTNGVVSGTRDLSGNNNWGSVLGPIVKPGISGQALSFDGVDDYVLTANNIGISGSSPRAIEFWVKVNGLPSGNGAGVVGWGGSGWYVHSEIVITGGKWYFWGGNNDWDTGVTVPTNTWQHHAIIFNNSQLRWFINGLEIGSGANLPLINTTDSQLELGFSKNPDYFNEYFNGLIDEVRIYNRALLADEVLQHYQQTRRNLGM
jgi:hypothetical protein